MWVECHDYGDFASQRPQQRGRGRRHLASTVEVDEVADRFQRDILLVSSLLRTISNRGT
jgi:hypothetical protein